MGGKSGKENNGSRFSSGPKVEKVYSPDLQVFSFEGRSGAFSILASLIVGPVRLVSRVIHNIMILPANLLNSYAEGLMVCGVACMVIGIVDYVVYGKWPLLVSQIPVLFISRYLKQRAKKAIEISEIKHEVEIDNEQVEALCNTVYDKLDYVLGDKS